MAQGIYSQALRGTKPWNVGKRGGWQDIIGTMPSLTTGQAGVGTPLSEYLAEAIPSAQPAQGHGTGYVMPGDVKTEGVFPEALEQYYQEALYKPAMAEFEEYTMPRIKESYVATGAITGTEVASRITRERGKLQQSLLATKAAMAYKDYIARNPAVTDILQAALSYLNIPMMAAYQIPEKKPIVGPTYAGGTVTPYAGPTSTL